MTERPPGWYALLVFGGLAAVIGVTVFTAVTDPAGERTFRVAVQALTMWFVLFFAFWWYWLVLRRAPAAVAPGSGDALAGMSALRSRSALFAAMALDPSTSEAAAEAERRARRGVVGFLGFGTALCAAVLAGPWLIVSGVDELGGLPVRLLWPAVVVAFPVAYVAFMILGGGFSSVLESGDELLRPLGLRIVEAPSIGVLPRAGGGFRAHPVGGSAVGGERHGRDVQVAFDEDGSLTLVRAPVPDFRITSDSGRLRAASGAPAEVEDALRGIRRAKRWNGVEVAGGPEGIAGRRRTDAADAWLYDLWLAERLARQLG